MNVHPYKPAARAVDACGGKFPTPKNDYDSGWQAGHEAALDVAMEAVKPVDVLMSKLLEVLQELFALVNGEAPSLLDEDSGGNTLLALEVEAVIARAA